MDAILSLTSLTLLLVILRAIAKGFRSSQINGPYPPGPKQKPIIGNLLDLQTEDPHEEYVKWGKKYNSDILFATAFGSHVLILNNQADADELFDRRAKLYSDRPYIPMRYKVGWRGMISLMRYGDYWRLCRRMCQQHFNYESAKKYRPAIEAKVHKFLAALLDSPDQLFAHSNMMSVSFAMSTMYGYEVKSIDDPLVSSTNRALVIAGSLLTPESSSVNLFPFLLRIPSWISRALLPSIRAAEEAERLTQYMQSSMQNFVKKSIATGTVVPSLITDYFEKQSGSNGSDAIARVMDDVAFTTYAGATDTTIAVTATFICLMAKHPEVQAKAQAEIDGLLGSARLPSFEDRPFLPYIEAIYREVMRWSQSLPLGAPHAVTEDDYYKGYFIPKGTTVLGNIWAMTHDERIYPDPYAFRPERFFDENGKLDNNSRVLAYGFGRRHAFSYWDNYNKLNGGSRICVGKAVASSFSWFMMVSVLASFTIKKAKDVFGNEIEVDDGYHTGGVFRHKNDYQCEITARSPVHRDLIAEQNTGN